MAGGALLTDEEITCIAESVARRETTQQTYHRYTDAFPKAGRKLNAVTSLRSNPKVLDKIQHIVDAGLAALHPVIASGKRHVADVEHDTVSTSAVRTTWDPESQELTILKPKNAQWTKPADLLERAGIAFELDDLGHPVPLRYTMPPIELNEWGTAMKVGPERRPIVVPNWQCAMKLRPRNDAPVLQAMERILERIGDAVPPRPVVSLPAHDEPHLLEIVLPDLHFGKLSHHEETGEDTDSGIIRDRMMAAAESLISRAVDQYPVGEFVFVVGNDLLNADTEAGTTTGGTRQDVDSRKHKVLDIVMESMTHVLDRLLQIAPGSVYCVPGNHDWESSQAVARFLSAWYRQTDHLQVDTSPKSRKYHRYGDVLLGFTHGHMEPVKQLPLIMADECPEFGATRIREWHIGHVHKASEFTTLTTDETRGIRVRHLPSLSGLDAWHDQKGYRSLKQADAFVWSGSRGLRSIIVEQPAGAVRAINERAA